MNNRRQHIHAITIDWCIDTIMKIIIKQYNYILFTTIKHSPIMITFEEPRNLKFKISKPNSMRLLIEMSPF